MAGKKFAGLFETITISGNIGLEDFADKLNFFFTVHFLLLLLSVVAVKSYMFKPLACYIPTAPTGSNFESYMENYCWVHGTVPVMTPEKLPTTPEEWGLLDSIKRISYYQWIPFFLALQCILFYLPKVFWQLLCHNKLGINLETLVQNANKASNKPPEERKTEVEKICKNLDNLLYQHRDYRKGHMADFRRKMYNSCNFCVCSKHLGTWLVMSYLFVKALYSVNVFGQLYLMKRFLGFNSSVTSFGYNVFMDLVNGKDWHETGIFPRVTYCYNAEIKHLGTSNTYVAQCALPINMLNEKIYVFLWFWMFIVGLITIISIIVWFIRIVSVNRRVQFIKRFLVLTQAFEKEKIILNQFVSEYLRYDGVFLIRMIFISSGDMVTADIVKILWQTYREKYMDIDFRNFNHYRKLKNVDGSSNDSMKNGEHNEFV